MVATKMLYLRIDLYKEKWEFEIYRNVQHTFHFDCIGLGGCHAFTLSLLGLAIQFHKSVIGYELISYVPSWWEKLIAFFAGATIHENRAIFKESVSCDHLHFLFRNKGFVSVRLGQNDGKKTA